jgi:hypothetical protein
VDTFERLFDKRERVRDAWDSEVSLTGEAVEREELSYSIEL